MEALLTSKQAASRLNVSLTRVRAMVADGLLVGDKQGRDLMVTEASVLAARSEYGQLTTAMRVRVLMRDNLTCKECDFQSDDPGDFHVHHIKPRAEGGTNEIENLQALCCECHREKHRTVDPRFQKQTFNARFTPEVFYAIADLLRVKYGRDKTEAVSRAIFEARERVTGDAAPNYAYATPQFGSAAGQVKIADDFDAPLGN